MPGLPNLNNGWPGILFERCYMDYKKLIKAKKLWVTMLEKKLDPVKECKRLRISIGLYEEFLRSLPLNIIEEIRSNTVGK